MAAAFAEALQSDIATRADVRSVRADLREAELRLEAKIEATKSDLIKGVVGTIGFRTVVLLGAALALSRALAH